MKKNTLLIWLLPSTAAIAFFVVLGIYIIHFGERGISTDPKDWGPFGDYMGGVLNPLFSLLALAAVVITFRVQMGEVAAAGKHAELSANAAMQATQISRLTMIASNRAHIVFNGEEYISHRDSDSGTIFWRTSVRWVNKGKTPAMGCRISVRFRWTTKQLSDPKELDWSEADGVPALSISPGAGIGTGVSNFKGADLQSIGEERFLYVWGWCTYRDVFDGTPERRTQFALVSTGTSGNPEEFWDEKRPFNPHLRHFGSANVVDEDCADFMSNIEVHRRQINEVSASSELDKEMSTGA